MQLIYFPINQSNDGEGVCVGGGTFYRARVIRISCKKKSFQIQLAGVSRRAIDPFPRYNKSNLSRSMYEQIIFVRKKSFLRLQYFKYIIFIIF